LHKFKCSSGRRLNFQNSEVNVNLPIFAIGGAKEQFLEHKKVISSYGSDSGASSYWWEGK
jgi:hypothetical protein